MMMDIKKIKERRWQIGAYDVTLPPDVADTQEEAFKAALTSMHHGTHNSCNLSQGRTEVDH